MSKNQVFKMSWISDSDRRGARKRSIYTRLFRIKRNRNALCKSVVISDVKNFVFLTTGLFSQMT